MESSGNEERKKEISEFLARCGLSRSEKTKEENAKSYAGERQAVPVCELRGFLTSDDYG